MAMAAAVPAACPNVKIVASTRVLPKAICVTLWQRPANIRFDILWEYNTRYGMEYSGTPGWECQ